MNPLRYVERFAEQEKRTLSATASFATSTPFAGLRPRGPVCYFLRAGNPTNLTTPAPHPPLEAKFWQLSPGELKRRRGAWMVFNAIVLAGQ